jgi:starch-binding outer membrane protein SusE/F
MKKIFLLSAVIAAVLVYTGCRKVADLPYYNNGNKVTLSASKTTVAPALADSTTEVVSFSWTNPGYATDSNSYKYVIELDTASTPFVSKFTKEVIGKRVGGFTGRELNNFLLNYGINLNTAKDVYVRVASSYGNNNERYYSNIIKLTVSPFTDPSKLTATVTTVAGTLATGGNPATTFNWTPSFPGYSGIVTYTLQVDSAGKNFANSRDIPGGASVVTKGLTIAEVNQNALDENIAGGTTGKLEYRVKATTAQGAVAYSNAVIITVQTYVPILRFYMPGGYQAATGNGNDWDPATAPEFIRDLRSSVFNKMYYMYIYLPAGAEFKITQGRDWAVNYGGTGGNLSLNGNNLSVPTAGVYRVSFDVSTMKYDIRAGRMGIVGDINGWTPGNVFPNYALGYAAPNLFVGLATFPTGGWKLIDNNAWNSGSTTPDETRSYGASGGSGSTMEINGGNFPDMTTAGRYRVIWDGRDPNNIKYETSQATEMRVVGDGINQAGVNDWDPGSSPQMAYQGNGIWTITLALKGNKDIKFLAGNAWGAFDYEDAGPGATAGTRKIKWEGGDNFKTPAAAGTYTITLNENTQTMTIN